MRLTLALLSGVLLLFTLVPISTSDHWLVRGLDFPRLQFLMLALVVLAAEVVWLDRSLRGSWIIMVTTLTVVVWQGWWIVPYTTLASTEVMDREEVAAGEPARGLRILSANVLMTNRDPERLMSLVRQHRPDLLITLESDAWWQEQLDGLADEYPFAVKQPLDNLYGMHLYSRLPLRDGRIEYLVEDDKPSIHVDVALPSGDVVRLHVLHPAPPSPTENEESTARDRELVLVARRVAAEGVPAIVAGDLNDVAWSRTTREFRRISRMLDPRVGRGMYNTYHAGIPIMRWPLDHIFHTDNFTVGVIRRLPDIGSDHFPLLSELQFEPAAAARQEGLEP